MDYAAATIDRVGVENHTEEPFSRIQIPAAATTRHQGDRGLRSRLSKHVKYVPLHHCLFVRSRTAPLLLLTRILCSLSLLLLPLPLVGPFILAPEPQGTPQTAHQGPFAFASPVRTLAAWLMYCERDTCLLVSLPALHPLPAYHRSSPPRSLMVTSNAERRKCPTVTRLRCTQMVFEK